MFMCKIKLQTMINKSAIAVYELKTQCSVNQKGFEMLFALIFEKHNRPQKSGRVSSSL